MNYDHLLAKRTERIKASAIREILKVVSQPGMISLAGGLPAPASFPLEIINELSSLVIKKYGSKAFQYSATEGFPELRDALTIFLSQKGIRVTADEVCITSGSQGLLDGVGKVLISPGDKVVVEAPTYLGALQAFNSYGPEYICVPTDDDGIIPEYLEEVLKTQKIKFIYLVPTFQNPTGRTLSLERRQKVAELIQKYDALVLEDDPYSDLRFRGIPLPSIKSMAPDNVIYAGTLSKILAPGFRIGFYIAPADLRRWLLLAKQGVDLHTGTYAQAIAAEYITGGYLQKQICRIIDIYKPKQEAMLAAMNTHFPDTFKWSRPEGGMFIWVEGPQGFDTGAMYSKAVEKKVAYVPGKYFYAHDGDGLGTMRLNFTVSDPEQIEKAIHTLSDVIKSG